MTFTNLLLTLVEYVGIIAFAISGAMEAAKYRLDLFGVLMMGGVTALGGGVTRDVLMGYLPPHMFTSYEYLLVAALTSLAVFVVVLFLRNKAMESGNLLGWIMTVIDALGLGSFVATGTDLAMTSGHADNLFLCVFMGVITGVGGGLLRDIMLRNIPAILRKDIYALACVAGSIVYYALARWLNMPHLAAILCIAVTVTLRILAYRNRWNLPRIRFSGDP